MTDTNIDTVRQKAKPLANSPKFGQVKGFRDYTGEEAKKRERIKDYIVETFTQYGFEPAETPIIEQEEFVRGENKQDEAVSDIFKLEDKGNRKLALRYEFTFQLKRLMQNRKLPYKRYQIGPVFRDEPVTSNRLRQFTQCDVDVVGSSVKDEAEILALSNDVLTRLKIKPIILVNNRQLLNEILDDNNIDTKNRMQVLREIDKVDKLPEKEVINNLKKLGADKVLASLKKGESYFKKFKDYEEILELIKYCKMYGVKVIFSPTVIRGLSYYNGNVFEIKSKEVKETLIAGGSYEFNNVQCTGISFGLDRLCLVAKVDDKSEKYLIVSLNEDKTAIQLSQKLRESGKVTSVYYGKPSKALDYANSYGYGQVIFVGKEEVKKRKYKIKDMKTGKEKQGKF
ncbi:MAG: ATP phosphoribosyltransferase regulatory subunit [Candidatus Pacearchaeota archaeon]